MFDESDAPLRSDRTVIKPGEDISELSVDDLRERIRLLHTEIERAEAMIGKKTAGRAVAESVFRKS